eukprot:896285-Pleurochrysis_carterae.AAC.1
MEAVAQEGAAGPQGDHAVARHSSWLGAAGDAKGQRKLAAQRAKRAAKATERARIDALSLAEHYSDLKLVGVRDLRNQLNKHKLLGKTGFALSLPNRTAYVLQLQTLLLEANEETNNFEDGDSNPALTAAALSAPRDFPRPEAQARAALLHGLRVDRGGCRKRHCFEVDINVVGMVVADGQTACANQGLVAAGIVLYRIVWQGCPPDVVWYLGSELLREFEQSLTAVAAADEASAREDAELINLEEAERMPAE